MPRIVSYGSTRLGLYEDLKYRFAPSDGSPLPITVLFPVAAVSGFVGGIVGNGADIANVRMQNDHSLPIDQRRNYRNAVDALIRIGKEEGWQGYFRGVGPNCTRAGLITSCQLASYDGFKNLLVQQVRLKDVPSTQFLASVLASLVATTICSPLDVIKTKLMSSSGQKSVLATLQDITRAEGIRWAFRGWTPSFVRLGPQTVATMLFLEEHKRLYRIWKGQKDQAN